MQSNAPQRPRGSGPVLYQIDFTAVAAGKHIANSKRRIRWRFGFANPEALQAGETGTACRGAEHEITLVWSLTSGKRIVLADGQEVHFSNSRSNIFEYSWTMKGNHVLKVVAHAAAPLSPTPGFRQYDFYVNGQSFFGFPKVFRLGFAPNDPRGHVLANGPTIMAESTRHSGRSGPGGVGGPRQSANTIASLEAPGNPDEEEAYLQEAIRQSLKDDAKPKAVPAPPADLLDFGDDSPSAPAALPSQPTVLQPTVLPATSFGAIESAQSDPYYGTQHTASSAAHQSFTSLPAITSGYGNPNSNFAAPAPGALVVAPPSSGYGGYRVHQNDNPFANTGTPQPAESNPYAVVPASASAPYQYTPVNAYTGAQFASQNIGGSNPYGAPVRATNLYGAPPQTTNPYAPQAPANPYAASASTNPNGTAVTATANPYGIPETTDNKSAWTPPAPITTQPNPYDSAMPTQPYDAFNGGAVPPAVTPLAQQTPSSLGFGSPAPDFSGFTPAPGEKTIGDSEQTPNPFNALTMNGLASITETNNQPQPPPQQQTTSVLESAFAKLASLDNFSVSSNADTKRNNPFESSANSSIGGNKSLAEMAKNKPKPAKEIMKTPMPAQQPNASIGTNPYGQYTAHVQAPSSFGHPSMQQPNQFGMVPPQAPVQQLYGTQPQQPAMSQSLYGQQLSATYGQQPPVMYGHQPPAQEQSQFGFGQQQPITLQGQPSNPYDQAPGYSAQPGYY